jgi:hypothetical protein
MEYMFDLITIKPLHLDSGVEALNQLAKGRWKVIPLVPFGPSGKSYLALLGREKEEQEGLQVSLRAKPAIIGTLSDPAAN